MSETVEFKEQFLSIDDVFKLIDKCDDIEQLKGFSKAAITDLKIIKDTGIDVCNTLGFVDKKGEIVKNINPITMIPKVLPVLKDVMSGNPETNVSFIGKMMPLIKKYQNL